MASLKRSSHKEVAQSLAQGTLRRELNPSCAMATKMNLEKVHCAGFVRRWSRMEGGWNKEFGNEGEEQTFDHYTGRHGDAWEMSSNVRKAGGKTLYWKESDPRLNPKKPFSGFDDRLKEQVQYDFGQFKPGDVISMYRQGSVFNPVALASGKDKRKNSHIGIIVAQKEEVYTIPPGKNIVTFLQKKLGVQDPKLLASYPVKIKKTDTDADYEIAQFTGNIDKKQRLAAFGSHDAGFKTSGGKTITILNDPVTVKVTKPIMSHLYHSKKQSQQAVERGHDNVRLEDVGKFFTEHPEFSLYEHVRPDPEKMRQAKVRQRVQENLPYSTPLREGQQGDAFALLDSSRFDEGIAADGKISERMSYHYDSETPEEWLEMLPRSTRARMNEWNIPEDQYEDFKDATLLLGTQESRLRKPKHQSVKSVADTIMIQSSRVLPPTHFVAWELSQGYYQIYPDTASQNAQLLVDKGKIEKNDFVWADEDDARQGEDTPFQSQGPYKLTTKDGALKHGQRHLGRIWAEYQETLDGLDRTDRVRLVTSAYNCGIDCPRKAATQKMLNDLTGSNLKIDGLFQTRYDAWNRARRAIRGRSVKKLVEDVPPSESLRALEHFARGRDIPYNRDEVMGPDFKHTQVYKEIRAEWEEKHKQKAPQAIVFNDGNGWGRSTIKHCHRLLPGSCRTLPSREIKRGQTLSTTQQ